MEVFVARQPIFDRNKKVIAYELLYRNSIENFYSGIDGDRATLDVIANSFFTIGIDKVTGGKKAFVNFTEKILKSDFITLMPSELVTIEILESVKPTAELVEVCKSLKEKNYIIALDDFIYDPLFDVILDYVDIIKVDFTITKGIDRKQIMNIANKRKISFLAEKVESIEEFNEALGYGYSLFQGYFFSKPLILSGKDVPSSKLVYLKLLKEIHNNTFDVDKLEKLIARDVSLSYKLLKMINSSAFGFKTRIDSLKHAISLLGEKEFNKWLHIILLRGIGEDKPEELIQQSLIRAKFCELLAGKFNNKSLAFNAYLSGMFSLIDVLLGTSMDKAVEELFVPEEVKAALIGENNILRNWICLVDDYEHANWINVISFCKKFNIPSNEMSDIYLSAIEWAKSAE